MYPEGSQPDVTSLSSTASPENLGKVGAPSLAVTPETTAQRMPPCPSAHGPSTRKMTQGKRPKALTEVEENFRTSLVLQNPSLCRKRCQDPAWKMAVVPRTTSLGLLRLTHYTCREQRRPGAHMALGKGDSSRKGPTGNYLLHLPRPSP